MGEQEALSIRVGRILSDRPIRDVGRVLFSGESQSMAVEDDVNVFAEMLDDL